MSNTPDIPREIEDQLALYFDNQASPEVVQAIQDWLEQDPANAAIFAEYGSIERMIYNAQKTEDASAIFALLTQAEEQAEPDFSLLDHPVSFNEEPKTEQTPGFREVLVLAGYVAAKSLRNKAVLTGSLAAVLALGLTLYVAFTGQTDTPNPPELASDTPSETNDSIPSDPIAPPVATLTATHNAVWSSPQAEGASAPVSDLRTGSKLHPNQRLTLTQGFAEITTNRGAIAILEAPATIELIDNDNALQLHSGKLVGICETESSKGFLVRTPHMDITDIGTRFGVDATKPDATEVHVMVGEVEVARPATTDEPDPEPLHIVQGQALRARAASTDLISIPPTLGRFSAGVDIHRLAGTAATIHSGALTDSEWRLIAVNDVRLETSVALSISKPRGASQVTPNLPGIARWVHVDDTASYQGDEDAIYTVQNNFVLPEHIDLDTAVLRIDFHADDKLEAVSFNGRPYAGWQQIQQDKNGKGTAAIPLRDLFITHGINRVNLDVRNIAKTEMYLHLAWQIEQSNKGFETN